MLHHIYLVWQEQGQEVQQVVSVSVARLFQQQEAQQVLLSQLQLKQHCQQLQ
jgi:hypothetical protein